MKTKIKTQTEIKNMRESGKILASILTHLQELLQPGITTKYLDEIAAQKLKTYSAKAAFLGYNNFPAHICISINDEIVHGIPSNKEIEKGDLVGLDFGVNYEGMITDSAVTVGVGKISKPAERLLKFTKRALDAGINSLHDGVRVGDIGDAINRQLIEGNLFVIKSLGGHGVGHKVHEDPIILNFGNSGAGEVLREGMTIALEPIASLGTHQAYLSSDGWTYKTIDKSLSAQFEHTILITKNGAEILTA